MGLSVVSKHGAVMVNTVTVGGGGGGGLLDDRFGGGHLLVILLSILSVVVSLHGRVGLGVGRRVLGPLGLHISRLSDGADQSVQICEIDQVLGAVVHLLVKASLLVDLPVRRHQ